MPPPIPPRRPRATRRALKPESPGKRCVPLAGRRPARAAVSRAHEASKCDYPRLLPHAQRPPAIDRAAPRPGVSASVARSAETSNPDERPVRFRAFAANGD